MAKLAKYQGDIAPDVTGASDLIDPLGGWLGAGGNSYERTFFLNNRILQTLKAIEFIADNLAPLPGRKNLIWVSSAFPLQVGFLGGGSGGGGRSGGGRSGPTGMSPSSFPRQQQTWTADADKTIRALNDANLAIYPVDARGLVASASARVSSRTYVNQSSMVDWFT